VALLWIEKETTSFLACQLASKTVLSNTIRNTTATLLRTLAPLAGFTHSAAAVTRETAQLLPNALNRFPADVGMPLEPSYLTRQSPHAARFLALDVNVPSPPSLACDAPLTAETTTTQHHRAEQEKFHGRYVSSRQAVLSDLVNQNILLLPFIVDHLGGLGPLAYHFLYGKDSSKAPVPDSSGMHDNNCIILHHRAYGPSGALDLLRTADNKWLSLHPAT